MRRRDRPFHDMPARPGVTRHGSLRNRTSSEHAVGAHAGIAVGDPHAGHAMQAALPPEVAFPYGFPKPGACRVFVQVKLAVKVETAAFDVTVQPAPGRPL